MESTTTVEIPKQWAERKTGWILSSNSPIERTTVLLMKVTGKCAMVMNQDSWFGALKVESFERMSSLQKRESTDSLNFFFWSGRQKWKIIESDFELRSWTGEGRCTDVKHQSALEFRVDEVPNKKPAEKMFQRTRWRKLCNRLKISWNTPLLKWVYLCFYPLGHKPLINTSVVATLTSRKCLDLMFPCANIWLPFLITEYMSGSYD